MAGSRKLSHQHTLPNPTTDLNQVLGLTGPSFTGEGAEASSSGSGKGGKKKLARYKPPKEHVHKFPKESEIHNEETDMWTKTCACGFVVEFEKF